ncbi:MAG: hypothetical protein PW792_07180 [Acidobacteriaceae bacterium]|nr:hypothetical protein [Acidobacteriaceae bacterium]
MESMDGRARPEEVSAEVVQAAPYNFARSGQISNDQMRAIAMVNDGIARNLTHTLGAWLRSQVQVALAATEQMTYAEYLESLPEPSYICLLRLEPLGGVGLLELELPLALSMIDVLMGGKGSTEQARDVTDIEEAILGSVLSVVMRELNGAWETVGLRFASEKRESAAHISRLMQASERMLLISFDVQLQETTARLKLCLPTVVLNTIHRRLMAVREQPRRNFEASGARVTELLGKAQLRAVLQLPPTKIASSELRNLKPGYVLRFDLPRFTAAEFVLGGLKLSNAVPVGRGEHRGAFLQTATAMTKQEAESEIEVVQELPASVQEGGAA